MSLVGRIGEDDRTAREPSRKGRPMASKSESFAPVATAIKTMIEKFLGHQARGGVGDKSLLVHELDVYLRMHKVIEDSDVEQVKLVKTGHQFDDFVLGNLFRFFCPNDQITVLTEILKAAERAKSYESTHGEMGNHEVIAQWMTIFEEKIAEVKEFKAEFGGDFDDGSEIDLG